MINKIKYRIHFISRLLPFASGVKRYFLILFVLSAASTAMGFVVPLFYRIFIDDVILGRMFSRMQIVALGYFGIYLLGVLISYVKNWANYTLVNTTLYNVRSEILQNYFRLPIFKYETESLGDMKMRIDEDTNQIENFAGVQTINYFFSALTILVSVCVLMVIDWRLAIFFVAAIPLTFWLDHILSKRENVLNNTNRVNMEKTSTWLHTSVQGWQEIKALNLKKHQERQYVRFNHNHALYFAKWINYWTARMLVIPKIKDEFFMRFGLYFIGGFLVIWGRLKISDLLVFAIYYEMLSNAVKAVSSTDADLQSNRSITDRLLESLAFSDKEIVTDKISILPDESNIITVENVSFLYPNNENEVIHNFSLTIKKGERIAIVGKSGCGKTTLLKLMTGMLLPTSGRILFSGIDLHNIKMSALYSRVGFVMQENILFNTTIRENLLYGKPDATEKEMLEACTKAFIQEFICSLSDGLDTIIGERGIKLSGGQRQRLILARLFLRQVDVFIFDEATSALDQYSESVVYDAIRNMAHDKTIIVVAHRESSINLCDKKIVMEA